MKKNYIYNMVYQVLSLIIPIFTTPYLSRTLGVDAIGIFSYTYSIVSFFTIVAVLGTTTYGQRLIAYSRDNKKSLSEAFCTIFGLRCVTTLAVLLVYVVYIVNIADYRKYYSLMVLNVINVIFDITWFYQGIEDFKKIVTRNIFIKLLNLASIYIFIHNEKDLDLYILIYCGYTILGNVATWPGIRQKIDFTWNINPFKNIKDVLELFIPTVAMQVYTILDKSMLGWISRSTYESGCYEQAEKICRIATTIVAAVGIVITPRIANLYSKYKRGEIAKERIHCLVYTGIRIACMIAFPIMLGIVSVSSVFIPVFLGEGYDKVFLLLPIFSLLVLIVGLANVIGIAYLIPTEKQKIYTIAISVSACVNLMLNIFLIPRLFSIGAALASVVAEGVGLIIQFGYCFSSEKFSKTHIIKIIWKYIVASSVMFCVVTFLKSYVHVDIWGLIILICTGVTIYGISLLMLRDEFVLVSLESVYKKIKQIINKEK